MILPNRNIKKVYTSATTYGAFSLEWCPHEPNQNVFVCAIYKKEMLPCPVGPLYKHFGKMNVYSITEWDGLKLHYSLNTSGIFEQKWCPNKINGESILGVVTIDKKLELYRLVPRKRLELMCQLSLDVDLSPMKMWSLDWSTAVHSSGQPDIVCSDASGRVYRCGFGQAELELKHVWQAHYGNAWAAGFNYWNPEIFFSGGHDRNLLIFDARSGNEPVYIQEGVHLDSITSLQSNCSRENLLATGSWDECVRFWDVRNMTMEVKCIRMSGPVRRLKWNPIRQDHLLVSCVPCVNVVKVAGKISTIGTFNDRNMFNGADWSHKSIGRFGEADELLFGVCSDPAKLLHVSKIYLKNTRL